jgi:hypothetical protein
MRKTVLCVLLLCGFAAHGQQAKDRLEPLMFLAGMWHGEGKGPYGPYEFETRVERRGRWLLMTSDVFAPKSDRAMFHSTQIYGYDDSGLVLHLFDTAGSFVFRGEAVEDGARFAWSGGASSKHVEIRKQKDGALWSRYHAVEPSMFKDPVSFEGVWLPGPRNVP